MRVVDLDFRADVLITKFFVSSDGILMPDDSRPPVLRFEHVTVSFDGEAGADGTSRSKRTRAKTRIILGAAGSGKTVLLKTAMGLVQPDSGKVFVFGQDISSDAGAANCSTSAARSACCFRKARCSIR